MLLLQVRIWPPTPIMTLCVIGCVRFERNCGKMYCRHLFPYGGLVPAVHSPLGGGGEVLPSSRIMRLCRGMESHFHDWIDYYGVALFIRVTRMGSHIFNILGVRKFRCVGI